MVPVLACIKWFDCHLPGAVVSQGTSRPNAENCSGFPPPTRQSASIEAELLGLTSIYSESNTSDDNLEFRKSKAKCRLLIILVLENPSSL